MKFKLTTNTNEDSILGKYKAEVSRVCVICGPLGSGKTFGSCEKIFKIMCNQKPNRAGIRKSRTFAIRNTYPDLLSTTVKDWMELFGELGRYKGGGMEPPTHRLKFRLKDKTIVDAELVFLALDKPAAVKKLKGAQATLFWLNELSELPKAVVDMADLRHGRYPSKLDGGPSFHGMIGDTNSYPDDHWLYKMAEETKPDDWVFFRQPGGVYREIINNKWTGEWLINHEAENLQNLPEDYYKRGLNGKSESWIAVMLANEYGQSFDGKPIYKEQWIDGLHVSDTIKVIPKRTIAIGLDFGLTPAAVIGQETPLGKINILHEVVGEGMGIKQFVKNLLKPLLNEEYSDCDWEFIGDPAGNRRADTDEETCFKVLDDLGLPCAAANTNDPLVRWEAVREPLQELRDGEPAFQLHKRCKVLRKGFNGGYHFKRVQLVGDERFVDKPNKNKYSHPHDALQYLMMYFKGAVKTVTKTFKRSKEKSTGWAI